MKQRVPKGEKYWYVVCDCDGFDAEGAIDNHLYPDKLLFESGNYFTSPEEAEATARKLRAVFKGADVIEMPSEEEIESVASKIGHEIEKQGIISSRAINGYLTNACKSMTEFFNNKIVK